MDKELEPSNVLTSDELRVAALAASVRRGAPVARRRIVQRWSVWLVWGWLLPVIGLVTVLATLLTFASIGLFGTGKVFDTSQTWLAEQLGLPKTKMAPGPFDYNADNHSATLPNFNATPSEVPQLQIDRNYSKYDQSTAAVPPAPGLSAAPAVPAVPNPSSPPKPPGAQP